MNLSRNVRMDLTSSKIYQLQRITYHSKINDGGQCRLIKYRYNNNATMVNEVFLETNVTKELEY